MIYAHNAEGLAVEATPGSTATCPDCAIEMVPKCGTIVVWHWAHKTSPTSCHYKPETIWHLRWKRWALDRGCRIEVKIGNHRADIITPAGLVVELQSQSLNADEVADREATYGSMIWIYRVNDEQLERIHWGKQIAGGQGFWYKRGPKLLIAPTRPVYLDLDEAEGPIFRVKVNLKERHSDQWGTTSQRLLGIAWIEDRREVLNVKDPVKQLDVRKVLIAAVLTGGATPHLIDEQGHCIRHPAEPASWCIECLATQPVRTGWDNKQNRDK